LEQIPLGQIQEAARILNCPYLGYLTQHPNLILVLFEEFHPFRRIVRRMPMSPTEHARE